KLAEAAKAEAGLADPFAEHRKRPLLEHLDDYARALEVKGDTPEHVRLTTGRVRALLEGCGFATAGDVDPARAADWLASLPTSPPGPRPPPAPAGRQGPPRPCRGGGTAGRLHGRRTGRRQAARLAGDGSGQGPPSAEGDGAGPPGPLHAGPRPRNGQPLRPGRS